HGLIGTSDFLYVADSKLCSSDNMGLIAKEGGRFLTVMPRTHGEYARFIALLRSKRVNWSEVHRGVNPRGKDKSQVVYQGYEDEQKSEEGYRIFWYHSSQKQERERQARRKKLNK